MGESWDQIAAAIGDATDELLWGCFIIVEYRTPTRGMDDPTPYTQAAPGPSGWYVEAVSDRYLPDTEPHPLDRAWLTSTGFHPPDAETDNWWRARIAEHDVARLLADCLRIARRCTDPHQVEWRTGRFPDGPPGGLPIEYRLTLVAMAS